MENTTRLVPLTQGLFATVDAIDYDWLMQWRWHPIKNKRSYGFSWYVVRTAYSPEKRTVFMHREIALRAGLQEASKYDHINRNGLENTRSNLRPSTNALNCANRTKSAGTSSQYKGVSWHRVRCKWQAGIRVQYKRIYLGIFDSEQDAAEAYITAARKYFGEFACAG